MTRRAILQIGTEKTGTTTLQHFLARNRPALAERGFVYPRFCGDRNHTGLAAYALDAEKADDIRTGFGAQTAADVPAMRRRLREAAARELDGGRDAIFCNEHCHSRLTSLKEVARLRDLLFAHFDEVRISVYLRRQDQVALSLYSTRLKSGGTDADILPRTNAEDPYFNYARSLALWETCFGRTNMRVRLFDREALEGGSVIDDFLRRWDLGEPGSYVAVRDRNESIRPVAQEYLRRVNAHLEPIAGLPVEDLRGPLAASLARLYPGRGARPGREDARAFYDKFRASNELVREIYFPERAMLFDDAFDFYPEEPDARQVTLDDICGVAAQIYCASATEIRRLEAEIAVRDARLHWAADRTVEAVAALRRAVTWRPEFGEAYRMLAAYMLQLERLEDARRAAEQATQFKPDCGEYWHFLGIVLRRLGEPARAAEMQRKALALEPGNEGARRELDLVSATPELPMGPARAAPPGEAHKQAGHA